MDRRLRAFLVAAAIWLLPLVAWMIWAGPAQTAPPAQAPTATPTHGAHTHACMPGAAFCDTFQQASPGGRGGDLDDARWSFVRVQVERNVYEGSLNRWATTAFDRCGTAVTVPPDGSDVGVCNGHWMEALDDRGVGYAYNSARIRQPFDFAGRTGTVRWEVDAKFAVHGWWVETWVTDQPIPAPHGTHSAALPRNGIGVVNHDCLDTETSTFAILVVRNHVLTYHGGGEGSHPVNQETCIRTKYNVRNVLELRVNGSRVEVWGSHWDDPEHALHRISWADTSQFGGPLPLTRGTVSFQHAQYRAAEFGWAQEQTYHWGTVSFDGPALPQPRGYSAPDNLAAPPAQYSDPGDRNLGWMLTEAGLHSTGSCCTDLQAPDVPAITFSGVDKDGATAATVALNTWLFWQTSDAISWRLNAGPWRTVAPPASPEERTHGIVFDVPLAEVASGTNALYLKATAGRQYIVGNADLELTGAAAGPTATALPATATASPTPPAATATPTASATATPQTGASPTASPKPTVVCRAIHGEVGGVLTCEPL